ncbi:hypothetical protein AAFC00_006052 [Neodothiora populina]|uniref:Phosphotransferase n=1 Tax=Neodothiora populina TaxID=2781224 RepID=A0ABR3P845_9PEZI
MEVFLAEVKDLFEAPLHDKSLHAISRQLQKEFQDKLRASNVCMLPSFNHTLPTGKETGTILALDVGGSTFRLALVELTGRQPLQGECTGDGDMEIKQMKSFPIDESVRSLQGRLFFDWMACRVEEVLEADQHRADSKAEGALPMALAWSFPIEQTSSKTGSLMPMGKGFLATKGVEGQDICELFTSACRARNLNVALEAIVNDSSATLLRQAYRDPSTRISLIIGTGINAAIYLPLNALSKEKFGQREDSWWHEAKHVLVNTELSMFGKDLWNSTRWDDELNRNHPLPDFQPLEYKASGRFLGEIVRLVLVEAIEKGFLFGAEMPRGLHQTYTLDTGLIGLIESDKSCDLAASISAFSKAHPLPSGSSAAGSITAQDMRFVRQVSNMVTTRSAAYVATAVHALWELERDSAAACTSCHSQEAVSQSEKAEKPKMTVACNGSIMEKYPLFRTRCQGWLDDLVALSAACDAVRLDGVDASNAGEPEKQVVCIEMAHESSIFGAAVAAVADADNFGS